MGLLKLLYDAGHIVQSLAFAVVAVVWTVSGLFLGSITLTLFRTDIQRPVDPTTRAAQLSEEVQNLQQQLIQAQTSQEALLRAHREALTRLERNDTDVRDLINLAIEVDNQAEVLGQQHQAEIHLNTSLTTQLTSLTENHRVVVAERDALSQKVETLTTQLQLATKQAESLSVQVEGLEVTKHALREEIVHLQCQIQERKEDYAELKSKYSAVNEQLLQKNVEIGQLKGALEEATASYQDLLLQAKSFERKSQEEQDAFVERLKTDGAQIEKLEKSVQELLQSQAKLNKELLDTLGIVLVDLNESGHTGSPGPGGYQIFEELLTKLVPGNEESKPIWSIQVVGGGIIVNTTPVPALDPFTGSVLTFMLVKGYERLQSGKLKQEKFQALVDSVEKILNQFSPTQTELEYQTLRETIATFKNFDFSHQISLNSDLSLKSLLQLVLGQSTETTIRHPYMRGSIVVEQLGRQFGASIVHAVAGYYSLDQGNLWNEREIAMLIVGIAANLDLEGAKQYLQTDDEEMIIDGMATFRKSTLAFTKNFTLVPSALQDKQLMKDTQLLDSLLKVGTVDTTISTALGISHATAARLACIEYLCRDLVYSLFDPAFSYHNLEGGGVTKFKENMLVTVAGLGAYPDCIKLIPLSEKVVYIGVHLLPVTPGADDEGIVLFRGTFDTASICRDIAPWEKDSLEFGIGGPGARSFNSLRPRILNNWQEQQANLGIKKWVGIGHSLGGSDIARFMSAVVERGDLPEGTEKMEIFTFNAPHVERNTKTSFIEGIKRYPNCRFSVTHLEGEGDYVPLAGITRIAGDKSSSPNLIPDTIIFAQPEAAKKGPYEAHTSYWLSNGGDSTLSPLTLKRLEGIVSILG